MIALCEENTEIRFLYQIFENHSSPFSFISWKRAALAFPFELHGKKKVIQIWKDMRVSKG